MAAVVASKPAGTATKMKKPSVHIPTNNSTSKAGPPSVSPSSAAKRLPGQSQQQTNPTPTSATTNGPARPSRNRLQRLSTRTGTSENLGQDKKATWSPEPYVSTERYILKKFRNKPPSLIVHLHPSYFRFDQQDGSFSYHSEMRIFIEHLQKKTIPHDMLEELRKSDVTFYNGWLIVKVIDHVTVAADSTGYGTVAEDERPFSIHNYNQYITPSPHVPYPTKEQQAAKSPTLKHEKSGTAGSKSEGTNVKSEETVEPIQRSSRPNLRTFYVALRPTNLSKHMDLMLDAIAPDPKAKKVNNNSRTPGTAIPSTPLGTVPSTPATEKPPPAKKVKLRIDPKDHLEYEARMINATAPPLYLEPISSAEETEQVFKALADPFCNEPPPSPKSRKRTIAELAADDAHAKEQERFMLIMDSRGTGSGNAANAGTVDTQAGNVPFQPRFEKFNALDNIKREMAEKKRQEKERQAQEEEHRRSQQEEERRRLLQQQQSAAQASALEAKKAAAMAQARQQQVQMPRPQPINRPQMNGIPHQMQNQMTPMMDQAVSPVVQQGTPKTASSPIINNSRPMDRSGSLSAAAAGSPPRSGSSLQHAHPNAANMIRQASGPGAQSRNGTPQIPHSTPGMPSATPVVRQGTPSQHMNQGSPHNGMVMGTPQMMQAQMQNGMMRPQMTPQQMAEIQRRQSLAQQAAAMQASGQMMNSPQLAQLQAQQRAQLEQTNLLARQQQAQAMQQQQQQQQGTPQPQMMSPNPQNQQAYKASVAEQMKAKMQQLQHGGQGSPGQGQMSPQQMQQMQQMLQQQQQQQQQQAQQQHNAQMGGQGQPGQQRMQGQMNPQLSQQALNNMKQRLLGTLVQREAAKYGGNIQAIPAQVRMQLQQTAHQEALRRFSAGQGQVTQAQQQQMMMRQMAAQQQGQLGAQQMMNQNSNPGMNANMQAMMQQQQHHQQQQAQHQQAQQIQAMQMANAQNMMVQQQYQAQMQQMIQRHQNGQGGPQ